MKHRVKSRKLNRTSAHHKAMQRNLAQSLIQHGRITTTVQKAKDLRPFVETLVTLARGAREGSITARRRIHKLLSDRSFIPDERQADYDNMSMAQRAKTLRARSGRRYRTGAPKGKLAFTGESITHRLITGIAERFGDRPGGYTRIIRLGKRRLGDGGELAVLEWVGSEESPGALTNPPARPASNGPTPATPWPSNWPNSGAVAQRKMQHRSQRKPHPPPKTAHRKPAPATRRIKPRNSPPSTKHRKPRASAREANSRPGSAPIPDQPEESSGQPPSAAQ
jgi:large subunit ribosomal protein L17